MNKVTQADRDAAQRINAMLAEARQHFLPGILTAHRLAAYAPEVLTPEVVAKVAGVIDQTACIGDFGINNCHSTAKAALLAALATLRGDV